MLQSHKTATIIAFVPRQHQAGQMSKLDRRDALSWLATSTYAHIAFEPCSDRDNPELGDFLLIYRHDATWAAWGVGCAGQGLIVWDAVTSETLGWFRTMRDALDSVPIASTNRKKPYRRRVPLAIPVAAATPTIQPATALVATFPTRTRTLATHPSTVEHDIVPLPDLLESI